MRFTHYANPYGMLVMEDVVFTPITVATHGDHDYVRECECHGCGEVEGIVVEGSERSRLFQATHERSMVGERHRVWAVSPVEWAASEKTTALV
jgi:hypothetical protein